VLALIYGQSRQEDNWNRMSRLTLSDAFWGFFAANAARTD